MSESQGTIVEYYTLPSKGKIYGKPVNPNIKLRSMTTEDEMRRLSPSADAPYKAMSDVIEACLIEKPGIPVYDLCVGDYQFLLHKLRIVTYGAAYRMAIRCPICGHIHQATVDLDTLEILEYDEEKGSNKVILPQSQKEVELNFQTPRSLDIANKKQREMSKKVGDKNIDFSLLYSLTSMIKTVDGVTLGGPALENFVRKLPMRDTNILFQAAEKLNKDIGINTIFTSICPSCGNDMESPFRITAEFFGPTVY